MRTLITTVAAVGFAVVACNHESAPAGSATTSGANVVTNDDAVKRLADAYCRRAKDCNYIGEGESKRYASDAECKREQTHDLNAELRPGECPGGIRGNRLSNCLQEIQNHQCGSASDHISRDMTCRTGMLCID
jgi:hypothetical protein